MAHVVLDLETMGTDPFSPVISIGACRFEMDDAEITDTFYQAITLESCMEVGLRPSASTILWWMEQNESVRCPATDPEAVKLPIALDAFTDFLNSRPDELWGNSARFDCGLLEACYKACGKEPPWQHRRERCYRTIKNLPGAKDIKLVRQGVYHHALDDAISQAKHLQNIYKQLCL